MKQNPIRNYRRILSIAPCARGFGFAVLEGRGLLVNWGVARLHSNSDEEFGIRFEAIIDKYQPAIAVLEDVTATRRSPRVGATLEYAARLASLRDVRVSIVTRSEVRAALGLPRQSYQPRRGRSDRTNTSRTVTAPTEEATAVARRRCTHVSLCSSGARACRKPSRRMSRAAGMPADGLTLKVTRF